MNDAATRYFATSARTDLSMTIMGGLFSQFKNWLSGTISGSHKVFIQHSFATSEPNILADATFTSGASFYYFRRALGLQTSANVTTSLNFIASGGLQIYDGSQKTVRVVGNASGTQTAVASTEFSGTATHLVEIVGVGRSGSTASSGFKAYVMRNGDGSLASVSVDYNYLASPTSLAIVNNAGAIEVQNLSTSRTWNFYSTLHLKV
jgi:hypothetical protein